MGFHLPNLHFGWVGGRGPATAMNREVVRVGATGSDDCPSDLGASRERAQDNWHRRLAWIDRPRGFGGGQIFEGNSICVSIFIGEMGVCNVLDE
jgi:hypothetical protein